MKENIINAKEKFRPQGLDYVVKIKVEINIKFIIAVVKCVFQKKDLLITHTFDSDPFIK